MCRLQTLPDDMAFNCGRTDVQKMLGNVRGGRERPAGTAVSLDMLSDHPANGRSRHCRVKFRLRFFSFDISDPQQQAVTPDRGL